MNEFQKILDKAYGITDHMAVSGGAIEQMAALRQALREAYAAAKQDQSNEEDGK